MNEIEKNNQLSDEQLDNVSGGIDMAEYETIKKMSKKCNYVPDWARQNTKSEEDHLNYSNFALE